MSTVNCLDILTPLDMHYQSSTNLKDMLKKIQVLINFVMRDHKWSAAKLCIIHISDISESSGPF